MGASDVPSPPPLDPPASEAPRIARLEMLQIQLAQERARASRAEMLLASRERDSLLARIDPAGEVARLESKITSLMAESQAAEREAQQTAQAVGDRLGLDLSRYVVEPSTGQLSLKTE